MKKVYVYLLLALMLLPTSCSKIYDELDALDERIDKIEMSIIPSIDNQIATINKSIVALEKTDGELDKYIDNLGATAKKLQEQISVTNKALGEVENSLRKEITTTKSDIISQLNAVKTELEGELKQINATIELLQAKDAEITLKVTELQNFINDELRNTKNWVNATFVTLEQYNQVVTEVATIKSQINAINKSIADLETRLTTKINDDISAAVSSLGIEMQQLIKGVTDGYVEAVENAKQELTEAYTKALQIAITDLDTSLKNWVGEQLSSYYTISEVDALLVTMQDEFNNALSSQKTYLESMINELSSTLSQSIQENRNLIEILLQNNPTQPSDSTNLALKIAQNAIGISQNAQHIIDNANAITANSSKIDANAKLIEENRTLIEASNQLIANNKTALEALIASNASDIEANAAAIKTNAEGIAKNAELIAVNTSALNNNAATIAQNTTDITQLRIDLITAKQEITEAYLQAIETAITESEGRIEGRLAAEISAINSKIDTIIGDVNRNIQDIGDRINVLEAEILNLKTSVDEINDNISKLLARIQSLSYIPQYDDGKATMEFMDETSHMTLDFEVSPKDAVAELTDVWQSVLDAKATYTATRTVSFVDLPLIAFKADSANGIISITVSGENLSTEFFSGTQTASVRIAISDGNNSITSDYIPMVAMENIDNKIFYTSLDNNVIEPYKTDGFRANIISNTYENGKGVIKFDAPVTSIPYRAFKNCTNLTEITIPNSVDYMGGNPFSGCINLERFNGKFAEDNGRCLIKGSNFIAYAFASGTEYTIPNNVTRVQLEAFLDCSSLTEVTIPNSVTHIEMDTFYGCSNLTAITIPNSVIYIGDNVFRKCTSLTNVVLSNNITSIGYGAFQECNKLSNISIPEGVTSIGPYTFKTCTGLTSITLPNSVTEIKSGVFSGCSKLTSITIPEAVTSIGSEVFKDCKTLRKIVCEKATPPTGGDAMFDNISSNARIYVPKGSGEAYKSADNWSDYASIIIEDPTPDRIPDPNPTSTSFKRRAMVMQFTGTDCPYSPYVIEALETMAADATYKDKFSWAAIHTYNADDPAAPCLFADQVGLPKTYQIGAYPTALVDNGTSISNSNDIALTIADLKQAVDNSVVNAPSAGISVAMTFDENLRDVTVRVSVKAKDSNVYRVSMWLLEDNISGGQSGSTTITSHDHAVRYVARGIDGSADYYGYPLNDGKAMTEGQVADYIFSINISSQSVKLANCKLVIFVTTAEGDSYTVVNSVVSKDLKTAIPFEYAE